MDNGYVKLILKKFNQSKLLKIKLNHYYLHKYTSLNNYVQSYLIIYWKIQIKILIKLKIIKVF